MINQTLDITTPSDREIRISRDFDAPRHLVFDAYTRPELLKRWLTGPPGWEMTVCEIDLRVGGAYRYAWKKEGTPEMGLGGIYREIARPERLVATERFDDAWYPGEAIGTILLAEQDGRTKLTQTLLYETKEARDIALQSGMEQGMEYGYNQMAEILAEMVAGAGAEAEAR